MDPAVRVKCRSKDRSNQAYVSAYSSIQKDNPANQESHETSITNLHEKSSIFPVIEASQDDDDKQMFRNSMTRNFGISHNHSLSHSKSQQIKTNYRSQLANVPLAESKKNSLYQNRMISYMNQSQKLDLKIPPSSDVSKSFNYKPNSRLTIKGEMSLNYIYGYMLHNNNIKGGSQLGKYNDKSVGVHIKPLHYRDGYEQYLRDKQMRLSIIGEQRVRLQRRGLTDIPFYMLNKKLVSLDLKRNYLPKIQPLDQFIHLKLFDAELNRIKKIEGINNNYQLRILRLGKNQINKIQNLEKLANLEVLDIQNNNIKQISGLDRQFKLKSLNLSTNFISKIQNISHLVQLEELDLSFNMIEDLKGIENLKNLKKLKLTGNMIQRFKDIKFLESLPNLRQLEMDRNPVTEKPGFDQYIIRNLPNLEVLDHMKVT